jgi:hypothetical protein
MTDKAPVPFELLKKFKGCPNPSSLWKPTRVFLLEVEKKILLQTLCLEVCEQAFLDAIQLLSENNNDEATALLQQAYDGIENLTRGR